MSILKVGRFVAALAVAVAVAACSGSEQDTGASPGSSEPASELQQNAIDDIVAVRQNTAGVWPGFTMTDVPTIAFASNGSQTDWAVVAGHPDPSAIGDATPVADHEDIWLVTNIGTPLPVPANGIFDFDVPVGGVSSYILMADHGFELAFPRTDGFVSLVEHEAFHIFQDDKSMILSLRDRSAYESTRDIVVT